MSKGNNLLANSSKLIQSSNWGDFSLYSSEQGGGGASLRTLDCSNSEVIIHVGADSATEKHLADTVMASQLIGDSAVLDWNSFVRRYHVYY